MSQNLINRQSGCNIDAIACGSPASNILGKIAGIEEYRNGILDSVGKMTEEQEQMVENLSNKVKDEANHEVTLEEIERLKSMGIVPKVKTTVRDYKKIGRNDPCPCGSGQKYKNCCLKTGTYEMTNRM